MRPAFMNRKDLYFLGVAVGIIALFTFLWIIRRPPPAMTTRAEHVGINQKTPRETCWGCHTPDSQVWQHHPNKGKPTDRDKTTPCSACHKLPDPQIAASAFRIRNTRELEFKWQNQQQK